MGQAIALLLQVSQFLRFREGRRRQFLQLELIEIELLLSLGFLLSAAAQLQPQFLGPVIGLGHG